MTKASIEGIAPFFITSDVDRALSFYCGKLGFETTFKEPDRNPFFAIVKRDAAQVFFKSERGLQPMPNPTRHPSMRWDAYLYVPDPDTLAAEFAGNGVVFSAPLKDTHDGLRGLEIRDPDGHVLFFGRPR